MTALSATTAPDRTGRFARRFRFLVLLEASLVIGALYDLAFAVVMVAAPELPGRLLGLPQPGERFYLWLFAVLLTMLASLYYLAARDPRRYSGIVVVAIAGRLAGAAAFVLAAVLGSDQAGQAGHDLRGLFVLAAGDGAFGLAHALFWLPIRK